MTDPRFGTLDLNVNDYLQENASVVELSLSFLLGREIPEARVHTLHV